MTIKPKPPPRAPVGTPSPSREVGMSNRAALFWSIAPVLLIALLVGLGLYFGIK